jgi:hypothetical protein
VGTKVHELVEHDGKTHRAWMVRCPACNSPHVFDARWTYNGNPSAPTFAASMKEQSIDAGKQPTICHSFLVDGRWQFLADCTHALKGQTVEAPDWDAAR